MSGFVLRLRQRRATCRPQPVRFHWDVRPAETARLTPQAHLDATEHRRQNTEASPAGYPA